MDIKSLLRNFAKKTSAKQHVCAVVQPNAIYFSSSDTIEGLPEEVPFTSSSWQVLLGEVLSKIQPQTLSVDVVLHSNLYQTYQIDKPNIPKEEWSPALPFLLKDLITEKVTDIIADAVPVPNTNKVQAYVISKKLVLDVVQQITSTGQQLNRILVEDDVWGRSCGELTSFLLLQRSKQSNFRISAFIDGKCAFQRTMRGVVSPLTGVASSALQLDGVALELQRSIDYLSSQLKGASLHLLKVCCDEEDQQELATALDERLNVKVSGLREPSETSGIVLAENVQLLDDSAINLYPAYLKPKKEHFTLANVAAVWVGVVLFTALMTTFYQFKSGQIEQQIVVLSSQQQSLTQQREQLNKELEKHVPSAHKTAAVARLKLDVEAKQRALNAVGEYDSSQQEGYSGVMKALAKLGRNDISLNYIWMDATSLDLHGLAKDAKSIPNWVGQFKSELNLVGRSFEKLKIGRNEQNLITFELKTAGDSK